MAMLDPDLLAKVEAWMAADPDPVTRAELQRLLEQGDGELAERFTQRLTFGTAGIRGPLGAGPARMNRLVVRTVTAGLAARLAREPEARARGVIVGRDARHGSAEFAEDTARVLAGSGFPVQRFPDPVPTPLVSYAVRHLRAAGGVQVTASHNPPQDNGYKVYWDGGAQIVDPLDTEISAAIAAVDLAEVPLAPADSPLIEDLGPDLSDAYLEDCLALRLAPGATGIRIVYTPLHGVAGSTLLALLDRAGFTDVSVVAEQAEPDPAFPTVGFPNPEEPGALDLAIALAARSQAELILANDPDGDRIAVGVPAAGVWRLLSGDEIGCLLAEYLLGHGAGGAERLVVTTVVSSRLLARIAEHHGVRYAETLTGFKWLAARAERERATGGRLVLAYEQALGVMVGEAVPDKDGISAALLMAELAAVERARGRTLLDALDDLARRHGVHCTGGRSLRLEGPAAQTQVGETLDRLVREAPSEVGGVGVRQVTDHRPGAEGLPPTPMVRLDLDDGSRLLVRPSGTEPLLKCYGEVIEPVGDRDVAGARARAESRLDALLDALLSLT